LDPFTTYAEGEELIRHRLAALSHDHLVNIIKVYSLPIDKHERIRTLIAESSPLV
jgi:hypothetical protein